MLFTIEEEDQPFLIFICRPEQSAATRFNDMGQSEKTQCERGMIRVDSGRLAIGRGREQAALPYATRKAD